MSHFLISGIPAPVGVLRRNPEWEAIADVDGTSYADWCET